METIIPAPATTSFSVLACVPIWPRRYPVFVSASRAFPPLSLASSLPSLLGAPPSRLLPLPIRLVRRVSVAVAEGFVPGPVSSAEHALRRMGRAVWNQLRRASGSRQLACASTHLAWPFPRTRQHYGAHPTTVKPSRRSFPPRRSPVILCTQRPR